MHGTPTAAASSDALVGCCVAYECCGRIRARPRRGMTISGVQGGRAAAGHVALPDFPPHRPSFFYTPLPSIADRLQNHRALSPRPRPRPRAAAYVPRLRPRPAEPRRAAAGRGPAARGEGAHAARRRLAEHRLATLERRLLHTAQCAVLGAARRARRRARARGRRARRRGRRRARAVPALAAAAGDPQARAVLFASKREPRAQVSAAAPPARARARALPLGAVPTLCIKGAPRGGRTRARRRGSA